MTLHSRFDYAVDFIRSLPPEGDFKPSNDQKLSFYSLFKQGSVGPCNSPQPSFWSVIERAKWTAWNGLGEMGKEIAQQKYIDILLELADTFPPSEQRTTLISTLTQESLPKPAIIASLDGSLSTSDLKTPLVDPSLVMSDKEKVRGKANCLPLSVSPIVPNTPPTDGSIISTKKECKMSKSQTEGILDGMKQLDELSSIVASLRVESNKNRQLMRNISASEEKIGNMRNELQSLFQQVNLTLNASKTKLDELDTLIDRIEELEEEQTRWRENGPFELISWTNIGILSLTIPVSYLGWYAYNWQRRR